MWSGREKKCHTGGTKNGRGNTSLSAAGINERPRPILVHRNESSMIAIYRCSSSGEGYKVIEDPNPTEDQIMSFMNEERISRYLPPRCAQRKVLQVRSFRGNPALHYRWAPGISLREWLDQNSTSHVHSSIGYSGSGGVDSSIKLLEERLCIAIAIAKSLCDFHEGHVMHQKLSLENIILDTSDEKCANVSLINLSWAIIDTELSPEEADMATKQDLYDLGCVLNAIFNGSWKDLTNDSEKNSMNHEEKECDEQHTIDDGPLKRGKRQLPGEGLPIYLTSMISALIALSQNAKDGPRSETYTDAESVLEDLQAAMRKSHIYLKPNDRANLSSGKSRFQIPKDAFYGRQSEVFQLQQSFDTVVRGAHTPILTCVSGYGGSGKTSLIHQIKEPLRKAGGYFISGKFDQSSRPDYVLIKAFDDFFFKQMANVDDDEKTSMKIRIEEAVGSAGCDMMAESIPNLAKLLGRNEVVDASMQQRHAKKKAGGVLDQWKFLFCKLLGSIAHPSHPIVFFVDDLQWADEISLDSIQMLVTDPDIHGPVHFLACYRDDEAATRRVKPVIDSIESRLLKVDRINLGPIDVESVHTMISEHLFLPPTLCKPLSHVVHSKTGGIVLFVINFLTSLNEEELIRFNMSSGSWEYDKQQIQLKAMAGNVEGVIHFLMQQMITLNEEVQLALKVAAAFGLVMDDGLLRATLSGLGVSGRAMEEIVTKGYLVKLSAQYIWAHELVLQAAYELIDEKQQLQFHVLIGSRLLVITPEHELDDKVFDIVRHLDKGLALIKSEAHKEEVARLNVLAGKKAVRSFSFQSAAKYLLVAISLYESSEKGHYDSLMEAMDLSLEPLFATGDFIALEAIIDKTLACSKSFRENTESYLYRSRLLAATSKYDEAVSNILLVVEHFGETIPTEITKELVFEEMKEVKTVLANYSESEILSLPSMTDEATMIAMQFLGEAISLSFLSKPALSLMLTLRTVKLSIKFGLCDVSSTAFVAYGMLLVGPLVRDFDGGNRIGRIAIEIMKKFNMEKLTARINLIFYGSIAIWKQPFQACKEKLLEGHEKGALTGDTEYAATNLTVYASMALFACGEDLSKLKSCLKIYIRRAQQQKQEVMAKCILTQYSLVLQFMGINEDCYLAYFHCSEDDFLQTKHGKNEYEPRRLLCYKKLFESVFSDHMDAAAHWMEESKRYHIGMNACFVVAIYGEFLFGLVAFHFACRSGEEKNNKKKYSTMGETAVKLMKEGALNSRWNYSNKLFLLQAENYFFKGEEAMASEKYDAAINAAHEHRFIHEKGLASEKAASFHRHHGRKTEALSYFNQAKNCYKEWGALALVARIDSEIKQLKKTKL